MNEHNKKLNLVFAVCHPDDEAIWVGGLLHGLSQLQGFVVYVVCLSGLSDHSPRAAEFEASKATAGYRAGVVMGGVLGPANQPLPPIAETLVDGISSLELSLEDIDLLITHSPYGDEHMHPHHVQACEELFVWCRQQNISFGYFSCVPLPNSRLQPEIRNIKRAGPLQLLNYAWCRYGFIRNLFRVYEGKPWRYPLLYTQWLVDAKIKRNMLNCYQSVDVEQHMEGYAMFSSNVETLYLFDDLGVNLIDRVVASMDVPGCEDYFPGTWTVDGLRDKILGKNKDS